MRTLFVICVGLIVSFSPSRAEAQEGLPIYSDYLTDNYYLLYPSMAGVANCNKVRLTGRQQWFGHDDAPQLQTISYNGRIGDTPSAIGAMAYADKNGYHSQTGAYLTYAHHIMFSRNMIDANMLSFGLSAGMVQYKLDETSFPSGDPLIGGVEQSATDFNVDLGFSYHLYDFYAPVAAKNILKNDGVNFNEQGLSYDNLRTYLASVGYVFGSINSDWSYEPSFLIARRDATKETFFDANMKVYRDMEFGNLWAGMSYRRSLDGAQYTDGSGIQSQKLQYFTPFIGVEVNNFMFAYTYSYQSNSVVFQDGGFHQITLGFNFGCRKEKFECNCPSIN
jgi:type IX secretion system PorP/SprF family membrane protein